MSIETSTSSIGDERAARLAWVILPLLVWLLYFRSLGYGLIAEWDDGLYLLNRAAVENWFAVPWRERLLTPELGYPVPLPTFFYFLFHQLPAAAILPVAHGFNVALHTINALLVFRLTSLWSRSAATGLAVAAIWCVHPLQVETVAWLTSLKGLCLAAFVLSSVLSWESWLARRRHLSLVATFLFFLGALASKPEGIVLPALLLVIAYLRAGWRLWSKATVMSIAAMTVVACAYLPAAIAGHDALVLNASADDPFTASWEDRLPRIGTAAFLQALNLFRPTELHPAYYPDAFGDGSAWIGGGILLAFLAAATWAVLRRHRYAGGLLFAAAFYLPSSGITFIPRFTSDSYMYLPSIGLVLVLTQLFRAALPEDGQRRIRRIVGVSTVLMLFFVSWTQVPRWHDTYSLWEPLTRLHPDQPRPHWMAGRALAAINEDEKALEHFEAGYQGFARYGTIPLAMARSLESVSRYQDAMAVAKAIESSGGTMANTQTPCFICGLFVRHPDEFAREAGLDVAAERCADRGFTGLSIPVSELIALLEERGLHESADTVRRLQRSR